MSSAQPQSPRQRSRKSIKIDILEITRPASRSATVVQQDTWRKWLDIVILIFINFMNYTDRYSLAAILIDIQKHFNIKNDNAGLIQTVFVITYMLVAPICGYLGDRYNRKFLLAFGVIVWHAGNVSCSLVTKFWSFMIFRAVFGIGQACWTTIAPSLISDLFIGRERSRVLAIFYSAIPVGNGLAYIVGTQTAEAFGDWRWSLRVTAFIGIINIVLLLAVLREPRRGHIEGMSAEAAPWTEDIKHLMTNRSFLFCTLGFTAVAFTTGAVSWWAPKINYLGFRIKDSSVNSHTEGAIFGVVSLVSGFCGLCLGYLLTFKVKEKLPQIDPVICGLGLVLSAPLLIGTTYATMYDKPLSYSLLFFGLVFMNINWALTMDICMSVVIPSRRGSAVGMQLLIGHMFGDAGSPYLTGLVSEFLFEHLSEKSKDKNNEFYALQYSYFISCAVEVLGGFFFFVNAVFMVNDMEKVKIAAEDTNNR